MHWVLLSIVVELGLKEASHTSSTFNNATDRVVRDFIAASQEEQRRFQAEVLAKLS